MNKILKRVLTALFTYLLFDALLLGYAGFLPGVQLAGAQTTLVQTTLAADQAVGPASLAGGAQGNLSTVVSLTSATGVTQAFNSSTVVTWIYVDGELEGILNALTGQTTIFNVERAQQGTKAGFHKAGAVVYIQIGSPQFGGGAGSGGLYLADPPYQGSCVGSNTLFTPWINVLTTVQWVCGTYTTPAGQVLTGWIPASAYLYPSQNAVQEVSITSAYTNATTTFSNLAGATANTGNIAFFAQANRNYHLICRITWQGSATTTGPKYQFTGPSSPTAVAVGLNSPITNATAANASAVAFSSAVANAGTITTATNFTDVLSLDLINGANSGTVQLQAAANGAGTLTVQPGSNCLVQ